VLDLKHLARELVESGRHSNRAETGTDNAVLEAVSQRDRDPAERKKSVVDWLNRYRVLMGLHTDCRTLIAGEIIAFADERQEESLHRDKNRIVYEFNEIEHRISKVTPRPKKGKERAVTSLASKALWCCYPNDVPIFDRNAASALRVISRLCHLAPEPNQREYARFVDVWLQVYSEIEPVVAQAVLCDCPYKVRVLDRLLWYLGQNDFYDGSVGSTAA